MKKPKPTHRAVRLLEFAVLTVVLLGSAVVLAGSLPQAHVAREANRDLPADLRHEYAGVIQQVRAFQERESKLGEHLIGDDDLRLRVSQIELDAAGGQYDQARRDVAAL